jgi:hypothetical protein
MDDKKIADAHIGLTAECPLSANKRHQQFRLLFASGRVAVHSLQVQLDRRAAAGFPSARETLFHLCPPCHSSLLKRPE